jgi:hypothetical protein
VIQVEAGHASGLSIRHAYALSILFESSLISTIGTAA